MRILVILLALFATVGCGKTEKKDCCCDKCEVKCGCTCGDNCPCCKDCPGKK